MKNKLDLLVKDMQEHGDQSSWDWEADERFALIIGDKESAKIIHEAISSNSTIFHRYAAVKITGITNKRLRALRELIKKGTVKSFWLGTEYGGKSEFGVNRVRNYSLGNNQ